MAQPLLLSTCAGMAKKVETCPLVPSLITLTKHWESNPNWKQLIQHWKGRGIVGNVFYFFHRGPRMHSIPPDLRKTNLKYPCHHPIHRPPLLFSLLPPWFPSLFYYFFLILIFCCLFPHFSPHSTLNIFWILTGDLIQPLPCRPPQPWLRRGKGR